MYGSDRKYTRLQRWLQSWLHCWQRKRLWDGYADGAHTARELKKSLTGFEERAFISEDYRRGYQAGYKAGYEEGYKNGYDEGFKEGAQSVS